MNDRIPGSSWSNPIWYRKWRIFVSDNPHLDTPGFAYMHDDYDYATEADDNRFGFCSTVNKCRIEIDERFGEDS